MSESEGVTHTHMQVQHLPARCVSAVHVVAHKPQQVLISDDLLGISKNLQGLGEGRGEEEAELCLCRRRICWVRLWQCWSC